VPVAAAGKAELLARDPQPLEVGRPLKHLLEQLPVAGIRDVPTLERAAGLGHAVCELVADPLEVPQAECPGLGSGRRHPGVDLDPGKAFGEKPGELMLEAADLAAQLGSRQSLVAIDAERKGCVSD